jgi:hypothetical protein
MADRKRKYDLEPEWTYVDEVTDSEHKILVFTAIVGGRHGYKAEVRTPVRFEDWDENANVLKERVFARCAAGRTLEWETYYLITASTDDFGGDPLEFRSSKRNYHGIGLLFEVFETAVLPGGTRVWRGVLGKSARYGGQTKPGWPPTGRSERGVARFLRDTPENRKIIRYLRGLLLDVAQGLLNAANPKKAGEADAIFAEFDRDDPDNSGDSGIWAALCRLGLNGPAANNHNHTEEATCPSSGSSSESTPASATAPSA